MKAFKLTDLEREVTVSLLENALNGWTGHMQRQRAAQRVINKLQLDFKHEADWLPWKLSSDSDPAERWILVSAENDEIEHPANEKYDTEAQAWIACEREAK